MHYGAIHTADIANGPGMRVSLFVSGCTNHCKGCFQPETWNFCYGTPYTKETENMIIKELSKDYYQGITLLGGEPFEPENQRELVHLAKRIKQELPSKDIWAYTGFTYETDLLPQGRKYCEITDELLSYIDVLVDGKFDETLKDVRLKFRGSSNQRLINLKETRKQNKVITL